MLSVAGRQIHSENAKSVQQKMVFNDQSERCIRSNFAFLSGSDAEVFASESCKEKSNLFVEMHLLPVCPLFAFQQHLANALRRTP